MTSIAFDVAAKWSGVLFSDSERERLAAFGDIITSPTPAERAAADIVITGWGSAPFPPDRDPLSPLGLVAHSAGTIRELVPKSLLADGLRVTQAAAAMTRSVAEHALSLTLVLLRRHHTLDRAMQRGDWAGAALVEGRTIRGTTVGVVSASRIGRDYIELVRALGADVVVFDPYLSRADADALGVRAASLAEVMASSEVVAVHAPVTDETRGLIGAEQLALVRDGGMIVNTARSAILDTEALKRELVSGRLSAALDVFDHEPLPSDDVLWTLPNVVVTPHIAASTRESYLGQGRLIVDEVERYLRDGSLAYEIRVDGYDRLA